MLRGGQSQRTMIHQTSATPDYTMGYSEAILKTQLRATAENSAAFLLLISNLAFVYWTLAVDQAPYQWAWQKP